MLVCHCFVIRACEVRSAIANGARSTREIRRVCRAGSGCGGCTPLIEELLEEHAECSHRVEFSEGDAPASERTTIGA
jgi:NAD(P)H-nitrite reductase large subunit